ncbi:hypothetical protein C8R43DRAFT_942627 [Mycena crocata]|nr:hypothetical protein C8R43DRAFT_942627 [Mycena crocata]
MVKFSLKMARKPERGSGAYQIKLVEWGKHADPGESNNRQSHVFHWAWLRSPPRRRPTRPAWYSWPALGLPSAPALTSISSPIRTPRNTRCHYEAKATNLLTAIELSKRSKASINAYSLQLGVRKTMTLEYLYGKVVYTCTNMAQKEESLEDVEGDLISKNAGMYVDRGWNPGREKWECPTGCCNNWNVLTPIRTVAAAFDSRLDGSSLYPLVEMEFLCKINRILSSITRLLPTNLFTAQVLAENLWAVTERIIGETLDFTF